jgi:hypothetical protein
MTSKLTIALVLLLSASSAALAAHRHHYYYGPHYYGPRVTSGGWNYGLRGLMPNDTRRSVEYQMDMGQWSGKINAN